MSAVGPPILVLRGATAYAPAALGRVDVVVAAGRILAVEPEGRIGQITGLTAREIDLKGGLLMPALVDQHCHPLGGGGWAGYGTLNEAIPVEDFLSAGIGTLVGVLGNDTAVRLPAALLGRIRFLAAKGLTTLMYTGEIAFPPVSLQDCLADDIALIPEVVGIKAAVGEVGQAVRTPEQLSSLHAEAAKGAHTAGLKPLVHIHLGNSTGGLDLVAETIERGLCPASALVLTHVNWSDEVLERSIAGDLEGVGLDVTTCIRPDYFAGAVSPAEAVTRLLESSIPDELITMTSDAGGSHIDGASGELVTHKPSLLFEELRHLLDEGRVPAEKAIATVTRNPADRLGLESKGRIEVGADADLLLLDANHEPQGLFLGGLEQSEVF